MEHAKPTDRFTALRTLKSHGIGCVLWWEDALKHFGVPTVVFDVFILVADPPAAAQVLKAAGWQEVPTDRRYRFAPEFTRNSIRLSHTPYLVSAEDDLTPSAVLLPALAWHVSESTLARFPDPFPPLNLFVEAFIDVWLDTEDDGFRSHLGVAQAYLLDYVEETKPERLHLNSGYHADCWRAYSTCYISLEPQRKHWQDRRRKEIDGNRGIMNQPLHSAPATAKEE